MKFIALTGRFFFSFIFLSSLMVHFTASASGYAASRGVPLPGVLVPLSGILAVIGGLSILFGYKAKTGAWLIVLFLIPVTLFMHSFWQETDPAQMQNQMAHFMKNLSMLGGALMIVCFGAGPLSIDEEAGLSEPKITLVKKDGSGREEIKLARTEKRVKTEAFDQKEGEYSCPFTRQKLYIPAHAPGE